MTTTMNAVDGLPSGSVSFVFTDIEGSTRLLRRLGDGYPEVLERHRAVLRDAWTETGGQEVNTEGDGCFVAFRSADAAVAGAALAQKELTGTEWAAAIGLRVRMGIHTGIAYPRDGDYVALAVHQAARVVQAAHGGQVLVSESAVDALGTPTPTGVELTRLGRYRLRDFDGPVALFQVERGDVRFPAVRAVPADNHNLSPPRTGFVGRTNELTALAARTSPGRLVTLVGVGGMGKTRLATEVGLRTAAEWADGVWFIDLSTLVDPALVVPAVAEAVGMPVGEADRRSALLEHLRDRRSLLILDNCEHVVRSCAALVHEVLQRCPGVGVLTTSREPLNLAGEVVSRLGPLEAEEGGVALFIDRLGERSGAPVDRRAVTRICERLDGVPLAIELAASRATMMSIGEILAGLDQRFRLLRSRDHTTPERQRTMAAVLDWSYDLLTPDERTAFAGLSVFSGNFGVAAATGAVGDEQIDPDDVAELIWSLAEKSLLAVEPTANATRYRMLETVRAYAARRLAEAGDPVRTASRLAAWYLDQFPLTGRGDREWLARLALEQDNISGLLEVLPPSEPGLPELARLRAELRTVAGRARLGAEEIDRVLARIDVPTPAMARLMLFGAALMGDAGDVEQGLLRCDEGERLIDETGDTDRWGSVRASSPRVTLLLRTGRPADAAVAEALANAALQAVTTDSERAKALLDLALAWTAVGRHDETAALYEEMAVLARRCGDYVMVTLSLNNLAETDLRCGRIARAAAHQRDALTHAAELGMEHVVVFGLMIAARIAEIEEADALAVRLHRVAEQRLAELGMELFPDDRAVSDAMLDRARARLGAAGFGAALESAEQLTVEEARLDADRVLGAAADSEAAPRQEAANVS